MIRAFIAIELEDEKTKEDILNFSNRLKLNQPHIKLVEQENLHMTVKFLGNIKDEIAPKIYQILKDEINEKIFQGNTFKFQLKGAGNFRKFSVIWIKLIGNMKLLQDAKDRVEDLLQEKLKIEKEKRTDFTPHLTIGRLKSDKINYKTFEAFKKIINEYKNFDFGEFKINQIKLKKSILTPKGPIYSDLVF